MSTQIQNVVATRTLARTRPDGTTSNVKIYIGDVTYNPSTAPGSSDSWTAWVEVTGVDSSDLYRHSVGVDSMQAIYLAQVRAGMILSGAEVASQIEDFGQPNFGFPLPIPDLPPASDKGER